MEVIRIKKILARNRPIGIYLHCVRTLLWFIPTMSTLPYTQGATGKYCRPRGPWPKVYLTLSTKVLVGTITQTNIHIEFTNFKPSCVIPVFLARASKLRMQLNIWWAQRRSKHGSKSNLEFRIQIKYEHDIRPKCVTGFWWNASLRPFASKSDATTASSRRDRYLVTLWPLFWIFV